MSRRSQSARVASVLGVAPWLGVLAACEERTPAEPSVAEIARAHAAPELGLVGLWMEEGHDRALNIQPEGDGFDVRSVTMPGGQKERVRGVRTGAVLALVPPLAGSAELYLCRFGTREVLLDPRGTRIGAQSGQPHGVVFERWVPDLGPAEYMELGQAFTVDPMPAGLWELVDRDEGQDRWAWLEVSPTGPPAAFRVRVRRKTDGEGMPANSFVRASFESSALRCEPPILGEARWRLRLSGEQAWLVPEAAPRTEADSSQEPTGTHFRLVSRTSSPAGPPPTWGIDDPGQE
jgi:hypothetical protein